MLVLDLVTPKAAIERVLLKKRAQVWHKQHNSVTKLATMIINWVAPNGVAKHELV